MGSFTGGADPRRERESHVAIDDALGLLNWQAWTKSRKLRFRLVQMRTMRLKTPVKNDHDCRGRRVSVYGKQ